jgi:hypothetical protein
MGQPGCSAASGVTRVVTVGLTVAAEAATVAGEAEISGSSSGARAIVFPIERLAGVAFVDTSSGFRPTGVPWPLHSLGLLSLHHPIQLLDQSLDTGPPRRATQANSITSGEGADVIGQIADGGHGGILNEHRDHRDLLPQRSGHLGSNEVIFNL